MLAFHVDYWNHLHWKDPYSKRAFTERQRRYAHALGTRSLYTPQMVVNGREEFVGSNRSKAFAAVESALKTPAGAQISLHAVSPQTRSDFQIAFAVEGADTDTEIHFALVERGIVRTISRGENSAKTLRPEHVARSFETVDLQNKKSGTAALDLPRDLRFRNASIIAFTQEKNSREITGATAIALSR